MKVDLEDVFVAANAAEVWGVGQETVKKACRGQNARGKFYPPKFTADECHRSGRCWLVTRAAMERVFGPMPEPKEEGEK